MPLSRNTRPRGRAKARRAHRRNVEAVAAIKSAALFEQTVLANSRDAERLVCVACGASVHLTQGEYRCRRCGRSASPQAVADMRAQLDARLRQKEESNIILTDDPAHGGRPTGLYLPRHLAIERARERAQERTQVQ